MTAKKVSPARHRRKRAAPDELRRWRAAQGESGISQDAAGKLLGVAAATWCDWESGKKSPTVDRAEDIERLTAGAVTVTMWAEFTRERRAERRGAT